MALGGDSEGGMGGLEAFDRIEGGGAGAGGIPALGAAGEDFMLPGASEGYDKQINALKGLVAEDPARVAQVVRSWVNNDG